MMRTKAMNLSWLIVLLAVGGAECVFAGTSAKLDLQHLRRAVSLSQFGERNLQKGNRERARRYFVEALEGIPELPSAHIGLGKIAMAEQDYKKALAEFQAAREGWKRLAGEVTDAYGAALNKELSRALIISQQVQGAPGSYQDRSGADYTAADGGSTGTTIQTVGMKEVARSARLLDTNTVPEPAARYVAVPGEVFFYIGNALYRLGKTEEAIRAWETSIERSPGFGPSYMNLALAYGQTGNLERARWCQERAAECGMTPAVAPIPR